MIQLNLGCFDKKLPDFINVDIREDVNPDVVDDAFALKTFEDGCVDLIYASHMLEHLNYEDSNVALGRWFDVLKPEGKLRIAVPDFEALCKRYIYKQDIREIMHSVCGSQKHKYDFHYCVYDETSLTKKLNDIGFINVKRYDWFSTPPHSYVDDFSRAYLPSSSPDISLSHGRLIENENILISLNLEAQKP